MRVEVLLEFLVGVVDADLLKTVFLEALEAKNVEYTKRVNCIHIFTRYFAHLRHDRSVDLADDPGEQLSIDRLSARVSC